MKQHRKIPMFLTGLILLITLGAFVHKFYVSNTLMQYNQYANTFEITVKIFTDDLEKAIQDEGDPMRLGSKKEREDATRKIEQYIRDHFIVHINDQPVHYDFIGDEVDFDLTFSYLEIRNLPQMNTLKIQNTLLFELFEGQANIVDIRTIGWEKKITLSLNHDTEILLPQ